MDIEQGHEDADLYGLPIEKVILEMSFDFQDFSIRWRDDTILGGRDGSGRVSEKRDDEEGDHTKDSGEIDPPQRHKEEGGNGRGYDERIALFCNGKCNGAFTHRFQGFTRYPHFRSFLCDGDGLGFSPLHPCTPIFSS